MRITNIKIHEAFEDACFIEQRLNEDFEKRWGNNEDIKFKFERANHPEFDDIFIYRLGFKAGDYDENTVTINVGGEHNTTLVVSNIDSIDEEVISPYTMRIIAMGIRSLMYTTNIQDIGFEVTFDLEQGRRKQALIMAAERLRDAYRELL